MGNRHPMPQGDSLGPSTPTPSTAPPLESAPASQPPACQSEDMAVEAQQDAGASPTAPCVVPADAHAAAPVSAPPATAAQCVQVLEQMLNTAEAAHHATGQYVVAAQSALSAARSVEDPTQQTPSSRCLPAEVLAEATELARMSGHAAQQAEQAASRAAEMQGDPAQAIVQAAQWAAKAAVAASAMAERLAAHISPTLVGVVHVKTEFEQASHPGPPLTARQPASAEGRVNAGTEGVQMGTAGPGAQTASLSAAAEQTSAPGQQLANQGPSSSVTTKPAASATLYAPVEATAPAAASATAAPAPAASMPLSPTKRSPSSATALLAALKAARHPGSPSVALHCQPPAGSDAQLTITAAAAGAHASTPAAKASPGSILRKPLPDPDEDVIMGAGDMDVDEHDAQFHDAASEGVEPNHKDAGVSDGVAPEQDEDMPVRKRAAATTRRVLIMDTEEDADAKVAAEQHSTQQQLNPMHPVRQLSSGKVAGGGCLGGVRKDEATADAADAAGTVRAGGIAKRTRSRAAAPAAATAHDNNVSVSDEPEGAARRPRRPVRQAAQAAAAGIRAFAAEQSDEEDAGSASGSEQPSSDDEAPSGGGTAHKTLDTAKPTSEQDEDSDGDNVPLSVKRAQRSKPQGDPAPAHTVTRGRTRANNREAVAATPRQTRSSKRGGTEHQQAREIEQMEISDSDEDPNMDVPKRSVQRHVSDIKRNGLADRQRSKRKRGRVDTDIDDDGEDGGDGRGKGGGQVKRRKSARQPHMSETEAKRQAALSRLKGIREGTAEKPRLGRLRHGVRQEEEENGEGEGVGEDVIDDDVFIPREGVEADLPQLYRRHKRVQKATAMPEELEDSDLEDSVPDSHGLDNSQGTGEEEEGEEEEDLAGFIVQDEELDADQQAQLEEARAQMANDVAQLKPWEKFGRYIHHLLFKITKLQVQGGGAAADQPRVSKCADWHKHELDRMFAHAFPYTWVTATKDTGLMNVIKKYPGLHISAKAERHFYDLNELYEQGLTYADIDEFEEQEGLPTPSKTRSRKRGQPAFVQQVQNDDERHVEWVSADGETKCVFCNRSRIRRRHPALYRVRFSRTPLGPPEGPMPPASGDDAETVEYLAGGRCLERVQLTHAIWHFQDRMTAALTKALKEVLVAQPQLEHNDAILQVLGNKDLVKKCYDAYLALDGAAKLLYNNEDKLEAGHKATEKIPQAVHAVMALHADLEAREHPLIPDDEGEDEGEDGDGGSNGDEGQGEGDDEEQESDGGGSGDDGNGAASTDQDQPVHPRTRRQQRQQAPAQGQQQQVGSAQREHSYGEGRGARPYAWPGSTGKTKAAGAHATAAATPASTSRLRQTKLSFSPVAKVSSGDAAGAQQERAAQQPVTVSLLDDDDVGEVPGDGHEGGSEDDIQGGGVGRRRRRATHKQQLGDAQSDKGTAPIVIIDDSD